MIQVLVVEDHNLSAHIAERFLTDLGCKVDCVANGKTALERFTVEKSSYDLVLMDISLPDIDGCLLAETIRNTEVFQTALKKEGLHIIALTAYAGEDNRQRCLASGMSNVLVKPLLKTTARDTLRAYVPAWNAAHPFAEAEHPLAMVKDLEGEPINFHYALAIHNGDIEFIKSALSMVLDNLVIELKQLQSACLAERWDIGRVIIHKLGGGTRYFGLVRLDQVCRQFSQLLEKNPVHKWNSLYNLLVSEVEKVRQVYETWLKECSSDE